MTVGCERGESPMRDTRGGKTRYVRPLPAYANEVLILCALDSGATVVCAMRRRAYRRRGHVLTVATTSGVDLSPFQLEVLKQAHVV